MTPRTAERYDRVRFHELVAMAVVLQLVSCAPGASTMKQIQIGNSVPEFALPDQNGKLFDIQSVLGKSNLVIYFYPKDDTPGCTREACTFRDQLEAFRKADAVVIGISSDDVGSHRDFADKYHLNFTLLSDTGGVVRKLFGVPTDLFGLLPGRVTYVVNKKGIVVHMYDAQWQSDKHIEESLAALKKTSTD